MKFLFFTTDVPPITGLATSGTALRTWGLMQGVKSQGHEVVVSCPKSALVGVAKQLEKTQLPASSELELKNLKTLAFDASNQSKIISEVAPDVIVCGHWPAMTLSTKPSQAVVIDLAGPHLLERHYQQSPNQIDAIRGKLGALSKADYFIVSGRSQRLYFLSFMLRADIKSAEKRICEITMPLDPALPTPIRRDFNNSDFPKFVFGGVFLPWQDPSSALRKLSSILTARNKGSLELIGGKHPSYKINNGVYEQLFAELSQNPRVSTNPMLPYSEFIERLCNCDVALDLMSWNLERQLAVTIRSTTYLWSGVPVIYNNFADLGGMIQKYDAGWCISPDDLGQLEQVCEEIYSRPEIIAEKSANAQRLAREVFSWDKAVEPMLGLLSSIETTPMAETDIILDFPENAELSVTRNSPIEQQFVCRSNGLSRVECRIATHDRTVRHPLVFSLYELDKSNRNNSRRLIARKEILPATISNNQWHSIETAPIQGSAGRCFAFSIEAEETSAEHTVSPWSLRGSPYPMNGLNYGTRKLENHALCFRTTCVC